MPKKMLYIYDKAYPIIYGSNSLIQMLKLNFRIIYDKCYIILQNLNLSFFIHSNQCPIQDKDFEEIFTFPFYSGNIFRHRFIGHLVWRIKSFSSILLKCKKGNEILYCICLIYHRKHFKKICWFFSLYLLFLKKCELFFKESKRNLSKLVFLLVFLWLNLNHCAIENSVFFPYFLFCEYAFVAKFSP